MVDTGATGNVAGSQWVDRCAALAQSHGQGTSRTPYDRPKTLDGVGAGASTCKESAVVPIALPDGSTGVFGCMVIDQSPVPALLGKESMMKHNVLLDVKNGNFIVCGEGGYSMKLSPGSRLLRMTMAPSGHWLLPVSEWAKAQPSKAQTVLFTEDDE